MIYTFYSFKGGVGRSMALANIGELFYRRGLSVLIVDFDLEAPGIERFFESADTISHDEFSRCRGVLDLLLSYKTLHALPHATPSPEGGATTASPQAPPFTVEPLKNFVVPIYSDTGNGASLSIMPAGRRDDDEYSLYAERIRAFDWDDFYVNWDGEQFFNWFARELDTLAKVVLIDSRTGITEMSGVCTHQLADCVALFVAPNQQNLDGVQRMARSLSREELVAKGRKGRPLSLLVVPSRIEPGEGDKLDAFAALFDKELAGFIDPRLKFEGSAFVNLRIPYVQHYAYMETVAVREPNKPKSADLITAYTKVSDALVELAPPTSILYTTYHSTGQESTPSTSAPRAAAQFVGRQWALDAIFRWLAAPEPATMVVTGDPGSGKTALLAHVAQLSRGPAISADVGHIPHVAIAYSCTGAPGEAIQFIKELARNLSAFSQPYTHALTRSASDHPSISVQVEQRIGRAQGTSSRYASLSLQSLEFQNAQTEEAFHFVIVRPLQQMLSDDNSEPVLIVVDALDAALSSSPSDNLLTLITSAAEPGVLPRHVRFLLSTRRDPRVMAAIVGSQLDLSDHLEQDRRDFSSYAYERLTVLPESERRAISDRIADRAEGDFLYARLVVDRLLDGGRDATTVLSRVNETLGGPLPRDLRESWRLSLRRSLGNEDGRWEEVYRPFLAALAVAFDDGLTISQIGGIISRNRRTTADIARTLAQFLSRQSAEGKITLFHRAFTDFLRSDVEYGIDVAEAHEHVAAYFVAAFADDWKQCDDVYALRYTPAHLIEAIRLTSDRRARRGIEDALAQLLTTLGFIEASVSRSLTASLIDTLTEALLVVTDQGATAKLNDMHAFLTAESATFQGWNPVEQPSLFAERFHERAASGLSRLDAPATTSVAPAKVDSPATSFESVALDHAVVVSPPLSLNLPSAQRTDQIPTSVLMELDLWRQARTIGRAWLIGALVVGALTATLAVSGKWGAANLGAVELQIRLTLWILALAAGALTAVRLISGALEPTLPTVATTEEWASRPEVILLRTRGKRFRLVGSLYAASPFFEIAGLVYIICALILSISLWPANTDPTLRATGRSQHPHLTTTDPSSDPGGWT